MTPEEVKAELARVDALFKARGTPVESTTIAGERVVTPATFAAIEHELKDLRELQLKTNSALVRVTVALATLASVLKTNGLISLLDFQVVMGAGSAAAKDPSIPRDPNEVLAWASKTGAPSRPPAPDTKAPT